MVHGFLPILGAPITWGAFWYAFTIWVVIFVIEIIMTVFDPEHTMVIAGWNAFKYGCGVFMPAWALSQGALLRLVPAHGQWWQHWWVQLLILAGGLLLTLWMWLGEPLRGQISWKQALLPSKVYFQLVTIWVTYLLVAVLLAVVTEMVERVHLYRLPDGVLPPSIPALAAPVWAGVCVLVLVASIAGYAWSNKLDWGRYINQKLTPSNIELFTFGLAALLALGVKFALDAGGVATVVAAGQSMLATVGLP